MRIAILLMAGLALAVAACGGSGGGSDTRNAPAGGAPDIGAVVEPTEMDEDAITVPPDLLDRLISENAAHYTFACVFSYDFTEDEDYYEGFARGLPVPETTGWAVGTLGIPGFDDPGYITIYDIEGAPTNATEFEQVDGEDRVCLLPKP